MRFPVTALIGSQAAYSLPRMSGGRARRGPGRAALCTGQAAQSRQDALGGALNVGQIGADDSPRLKSGGSNDPASFLKLSHHRS